MSGIDRADATVLLHQFSEWLDRPRNPLPDDMTHDDLVARFLAERSEHASPVVTGLSSEHSYNTGCRCENCRAYQQERVARNRRERLARGDLSHGSRSAYDAGCRCETCRAVRSAAYVRLEKPS